MDYDHALVQSLAIAGCGCPHSSQNSFNCSLIFSLAVDPPTQSSRSIPRYRRFHRQVSRVNRPVGGAGGQQGCGGGWGLRLRWAPTGYKRITHIRTAPSVASTKILTRYETLVMPASPVRA